MFLLVWGFVFMKESKKKKEREKFAKAIPRPSSQHLELHSSPGRRVDYSHSSRNGCAVAPARMECNIGSCHRLLWAFFCFFFFFFFSLGIKFGVEAEVEMSLNGLVGLFG